jgi:hypothetical protein
VRRLQRGDHTGESSEVLGVEDVGLLDSEAHPLRALSGLVERVERLEVA